jgi:predicted ATP-grasp superfamily ATP-dependent carboligase
MQAPMVADVPKPGKIYETGEAIVSVMGHGHTRGDAVRMMKDRYRFVKKNVKTFKNE